MKKLVCFLLTVAMMLTVLSACKPEEHVHTFEEAWQSDETDHWHQANCEHADQIKDKAPHEDLDENDLCDVCGYAMNHTHTHSDKWSFNKDEHYHAPTCGCNANDKKYQKDNAPHVDEDNNALCDVCGYDYDHTHVYDTENWTKADETYHWHAPTCGHDVEGADKEEHTDEDNDGVCDGCDWDYDHVHTFEEEWQIDGDYHWHKATCGHDVLGEKNPHRDQDDDGKCDTCETTPEHFHDIDWDVWSGDKDNHWHATKGECAECKDAEGNPIVADFGKHTEWKEDGICDVCEYIVFHLYKVNVALPDFSAIVDAEGKPVLGEDGNPVQLPFIVKEGNSLEFYVTVPSIYRLEGVTGAEVDMVNYIKLENEDGTTTYLYKITVKPENDVTVTVTINKLSAVEVVEKIAFDMPVIALKDSFKDIVFNAPEAGRYVISCPADGWLKFRNPATGAYESVMQFQVSEPGPITITASYWSMNGGDPLKLTYAIVKYDDTFVLPYLEGEGYTMPTGIDVAFQFTLPEPGLYQFTSQAGELIWKTPEDRDGSVEPMFILCTYAGQQFGLNGEYACKLSTTQPTFDFDWKIVKLEDAGAVGEGSNPVKVDIGTYVGYTFTANKTGTYSFSVSELANLRIYADLYGTGYSKMYAFDGTREMLAGQTIRLYVTNNQNIQGDSTGATEDFTDTLTVTYDGYHADVDYDGVSLLPGASYTYVVPENGYYTFQVPAGASFRIDGGAWRTGSYSVALNKGAELKLEIKSDTNSKVKITISHELFEHTVNIGENKYEFHPGMSYSVKLVGAASPAQLKPYILTWTDKNVTVKYGKEVITSGVEFAYDPSKTLTIVYNGTAKADITLKLAENFKAPAANAVLDLGTNAVALPGGPFGREMVFTAVENNTYVLSLISGETNAKLVIDDVVYTAENLPKEFTLEQGQQLTVMVYTLSGVSDTVDLFIGLPGQTPDEPDEPDIPVEPEDVLGALLDGYYTYVLDGSDAYTVLFQDGKVTIEDNYFYDGLPLTGTFDVAYDPETGLALTADGELVTRFTFEAEDGKLVLVIRGDETVEDIRYVLTAGEVPGTPDEDSYEFVIGDNAFQIPAGDLGADLTFTAPVEGTYIFGLGKNPDGSEEANAWAMLNDGIYAENIDLPYKVYLNAGETFVMNMTTYSMEADEINLTLHREEGDPAPMDPFKVTFQLPAGSILVDDEGNEISNVLSFKPVTNDGFEVYAWIPTMYDVRALVVTGAEMGSPVDGPEGYWEVLLLGDQVTSDLTVTVTAESPKALGQNITSGSITVDFTDVEDWDNVYSEITFEAPAAGYYYVVGTNGMYISQKAEGDGVDKLLLFVEQPGTVTVYGVTTNFYYNEPQTYAYTVSKLGAWHLSTLTGAGLELSMGMPSVITVTLPEAGLYFFEGGEYSWNVNGETYYQQNFYYEAMAGETLQLIVSKDYVGEGEIPETYVLEWNISPMEVASNLAVGPISVAPPVDGFSVYTFTAQMMGTYRFTLGDGKMTDLFLYEGTMYNNGDQIVLTLEENETVFIYVYGNVELDEQYEPVENQEPADDVLNVEYLGVMPQKNEEGKYPALVGVVNSFLSERNAAYKITVTGGKICVDGKTWVTEIPDIVIRENEILYYMVQSDNDAGSVALTIERIPFGAALAMGENTLTLRPWVEYEVTVDDIAKYALSWDSKLDLRVCTVNGGELENGKATAASVLYITYFGEAESEIKLTVADKSTIEVPGTWVEGSNTVTLEPGRDYIVSLPWWYDNAGLLSYVITWSNEDVAAHRGVDVVTSGVKTSSWLDTMTLVNNGSATVTVTFQLARPSEEEAGGTGSELVLGDNLIDNTDVLWNYEAAVFTATEAGTYTFTANDFMYIGTSPRDTITVTLGAGESYEIWLNSYNDTVTITVTKS